MESGQAGQYDVDPSVYVGDKAGQYLLQLNEKANQTVLAKEMAREFSQTVKSNLSKGNLK